MTARLQRRCLFFYKIAISIDFLVLRQQCRFVARTNDLVKELLIDVTVSSVAMIEKRKLLMLMGRGQDRPSAWAELLEVWTDELGQDRDELFGVEMGAKIVLFRGTPVPGTRAVTQWAAG